MMRLLSVGLLAAVATGCGNAVYFATATQTGIDISAGEAGQVHARVGYRRGEALIAPLADSSGNILPQAPAALALFHLDTGSLRLVGTGRPLRVKTSFATGTAARVRSVVTTMHALETATLLSEDVVAAAEELIRAIEQVPAEQWEASPVRAAVVQLPGATDTMTQAEARTLVRNVARGDRAITVLAAARQLQTDAN